MAAGGVVGGGAAGVGDLGEVVEKALALLLREDLEGLGLEVEGDDAEILVRRVAGGKEADAEGAAVGFVGDALHQLHALHALDEGGDGVGVAAHEVGELALGDAGGVALDEGAHDGELVWGDAGVADAAAEGLVEAVPGASQEGGEPAAARRVERLDGERRGGFGLQEAQMIRVGIILLQTF